MACYLKQCWVIVSIVEYDFKYEWEIKKKQTKIEISGFSA